MKRTPNGLVIKEGSDNYNKDRFNECMLQIDDGLSKPYRAEKVENQDDTFRINTGLNKSTLTDLYKITVVFPESSSDKTMIIIDNCEAVKILKAGNGNKKVKSKEICNLVYDDINKVFMCASGSADDVSFTSDKLLEGSSANNSDGEKVNGTMPNVGQQTATINAGGKIVISKGYHNGTGYIQANTMAKQMQDLGSTLTSANQLINGVKAVDKNGNLITGTATIESLGGLELRTGTITINNTDLTDTEYSIQLSQLNLPRTPKFVACNWRMTYSRKEYGTEKVYNASSYTFFDFINSKCSYPTNTEWSHDSSGTYKVVDTIRKFTDKTILRMHTESNNRSLVPTKGSDSSFKRDPMIVDWVAVV